MTGRTATREPSPMVPTGARGAILAWYDVAGRHLPFRATTDPYAILVSEVMAQQTQVGRVGERWSRFLARFPTVADLAAATPADVLREWRGLGYDRRALNLWRAARAILECHDGRVPDDVAELEALPGIGPYTARAVAAIAFGRPVGAVDTNVRRVLTRVIGSAAAGLSPRRFQALADSSVPHGIAAGWTHALMDVGATFCRPGRPLCADCPVRPWCSFAGEGGPTSRAPRSANGGSARFTSTTRWLRGRVMDRLREAPGRRWVVVPSPIGDHDEAAVRDVLSSLAADGLIEIDRAGRARLALG